MNETTPTVWYFTPFYAILRAIPNKLLGVVLMGIAVVSFFSCHGSIGPERAFWHS